MYINYDKSGKILGYYDYRIDTYLCLELTHEQYIESQKFNKIILNEGIIIFEKVDFRDLEQVEIERVNSIKHKAGEIIKSKYPIEWQLNHPRMDITYSEQYAWIDNIRDISNKAETDRIPLESIIW